MPVLKNAKHELFAQAIAKGKTQIEAHELAGYKVSAPNASKMASLPDVIKRVQEITSKGAEKAACTVASIVDELEEARELAKGISQPSAMVSATLGKAKVSRLLDEAPAQNNTTVNFNTINLTDVARRIAYILDPDGKQ
jgi:hypothetical protein